MDTEDFWDYLCARTGYIVVGHGIIWAALGLNTISYLFVDNSPATEVIIGLNFIGMFTALLITGGVLLRCRLHRVDGQAASG